MPQSNELEFLKFPFVLYIYIKKKKSDKNDKI